MYEASIQFDGKLYKAAMYCVLLLYVNFHYFPKKYWDGNQSSLQWDNYGADGSTAVHSSRDYANTLMDPKTNDQLVPFHNKSCFYFPAFPINVKQILNLYSDHF